MLKFAHADDTALRDKAVGISAPVGKYELGTPAQVHRLNGGDWHAAPCPLAQAAPSLLSSLLDAVHRLLAHLCCRLHI